MQRARLSLVAAAVGLAAMPAFAQQNPPPAVDAVPAAEAEAIAEVLTTVDQAITALGQTDTTLAGLAALNFVPSLQVVLLSELEGNAADFDAAAAGNPEAGAAISAALAGNAELSAQIGTLEYTMDGAAHPVSIDDVVAVYLTADNEILILVIAPDADDAAMGAQPMGGM